MLEHDLELEVKNAVQRDESGKFVVSWPWKPQARKNLALNKTLSETRLRLMVKRMTHEEYTAYDHQLKSLLEEGHIELLPKDCVPQSYLPHRGVVKMDRETTKLRIVHDASAKSEGGLSLNDALEKGPNLLLLLRGILFSDSELARSVLLAILRRPFYSCPFMRKIRTFVVSCG